MLSREVTFLNTTQPIHDWIMVSLTSSMLLLPGIGLVVYDTAKFFEQFGLFGSGLFGL